MDDVLTRILPKYKHMNRVIIDRLCSFLPRAKSQAKFKQIKYWSVDFFHAHGQNASCPCNPHHIPRLARRFKGISTSAAEQVFAWFRNCARVLNETTAMRHSFKGLYFCKLHNTAMQKDGSSYLSEYPHKGKRRSVSYSCPPESAQEASRTVDTGAQCITSCHRRGAHDANKPVFRLLCNLLETTSSSICICICIFQIMYHRIINLCQYGRRSSTPCLDLYNKTQCNTRLRPYCSSTVFICKTTHKQRKKTTVQHSPQGSQLSILNAARHPPRPGCTWSRCIVSESNR